MPGRGGRIYDTDRHCHLSGGKGNGMTQVLQSLKEAAIFMLGAQVLMYLGPGKKYDKYGKMIVSLLVLAQLAEPLLNFSEDLGKISFSSHFHRTSLYFFPPHTAR